MPYIRTICELYKNDIRTISACGDSQTWKQQQRFIKKIKYYLFKKKRGEIKYIIFLITFELPYAPWQR